MKPELQQEAIAKYCGCRKIHGAEIYQWSWMSSDDIGANELPDYLNDLNAMHEAEKKLTSKQMVVYADNLNRTTPLGSWMIVATAAQRAEAFIRTLGIWVEEKTKL